MRRDVNLVLLMLIVVSILVFSGFSVYYQSTFKNVSLEYKNKLEQLGKVTTELTTQKQQLNETYSLRIKAEEDRKTLDSRYQDASQENDQLKDNNANLRSEISSTKSQLGEKTAELDATKNLLSQTQASLSAANSKISSLNNQVDNLKANIKCLKEKSDAEESSC